MARNVAIQEDILKTRRAFQRNVGRKERERARREVRMIAFLEAGEKPYTHDVLSWLSRQTGVKSSRIDDAFIKDFLAARKKPAK